MLLAVQGGRGKDRWIAPPSRFIPKTLKYDVYTYNMRNTFSPLPTRSFSRTATFWWKIIQYTKKRAIPPKSRKKRFNLNKTIVLRWCGNVYTCACCCFFFFLNISFKILKWAVNNIWLTETKKKKKEMAIEASGVFYYKWGPRWRLRTRPARIYLIGSKPIPIVSNH